MGVSSRGRWNGIWETVGGGEDERPSSQGNVVLVKHRDLAMGRSS